nr:MAG TPA: hypothetical protein [Bacteriophage sp.]
MLVCGIAPLVSLVTASLCYNTLFVSKSQEFYEKN